MSMKSLKTIVASSLFVLSTASTAGEVWDTNIGEFIYQDEVGPVAVWTYGTDEDPSVIYINGLAQVSKNRGSYDGYWAKFKAPTKCRTSRLGYDGKMTYYWGRFQVHFVDKDAPGRWVANWSYCNAGWKKGKIMAAPVVAKEKKQAG